MTVLVRILLLSAVSFMLMGCSLGTVFFYNRFPVLLTYKVNSDFDLTSDQKQIVRKRLDELQNWHRQNELPKYSAFLNEVLERFQSKETIELKDVQWASEQISELRKSFLDEIYADVPRFLALLSPKQIEHFEKVQSKQNKERFKAHLKGQDELIKKIESRLTERIEQWVGSLSDDQEKMVLEFAKNSAPLELQKMQMTLSKQKEFREFALQLQSSSNNIETPKAIESLHTLYPYPSGELFESTLKFYTEMIQSLSEKQRSYLTKRFGYWNDEIKTLSQK